ncbi:TlpA family protein disulfide reductase [Porticoccus sp. GXU_MW_L64]
MVNFCGELAVNLWTSAAPLCVIFLADVFMVNGFGVFFGALQRVVLAALLFSLALAVQAHQTDRQIAWQQINQQLASLRDSAKSGEPINAQEISKRRQAIISKAAEIYRQQSDDALAVDAMLLTLSKNKSRATFVEICRILARHHMNEPSLSLFFPMMYSLVHFESDCENLLLAAADEGVNQVVRESARLQLAMVYRKMAELLANLAEFDMTMEQYTISKRRSSFGQMSDQEAASINQHLCESGWKKRNWRKVRQQALDMVTPLLDSEQTFSLYVSDHAPNKQIPKLSIASRASKIHYQLLNSVPGAQLSEFDIRNLDGEPARLRDHLGKVVVIDVWATWCQPCITGFSDMNKLQQSMKGKPFSLVAISIDRNLDDARQFVAKSELPFEHWYVGENHQFFDQWSVFHIPRIIILDSQGVIRATPNVGPADLQNYVSRLVSSVKN